MSPRWRRRLAAWATWACVILWPVSHLTWARAEPPTILALSWGAMIISTATLWATTDVRVVEDGGQEA